MISLNWIFEDKILNVVFHPLKISNLYNKHDTQNGWILAKINKNIIFNSNQMIKYNYLIYTIKYFIKQKFMF